MLSIELNTGSGPLNCKLQGVNATKVLKKIEIQIGENPETEHKISFH